MAPSRCPRRVRRSLGQGRGGRVRQTLAMASPNDFTPPGDGVQGTQRDKLHVVVGWLPRSPGGSLAQEAKALAPAVLYGDSVTVICPQSDDALETQDYFDLRDAVPGAVKFDALDSRYAALILPGNR